MSFLSGANMKRIILSIAVLTLFAGCAARQAAQLQAAEQVAQQTLSATTQATADAQAVVAALPADAPGRDAAVGEISTSQQVERDAQLALNVAQAALNAAQKKDAADPALGTAVAAAVSAIPSPWTPVLASLIPAAIPLLVSVVQSVRLGRAHQTVQSVTQQLEEHKAALSAISNATPKT
jgi:hypothetical protein